eukprot:1853360-Alexandrium_andersonii.AAC.1
MLSPRPSHTVNSPSRVLNLQSAPRDQHPEPSGSKARRQLRSLNPQPSTHSVKSVLGNVVRVRC